MSEPEPDEYQRMIAAQKEIARLREELAAAQSKEVCTVPHSDEILEFCVYCKLEAARAALESIAKNTCCDKCQEAALVAKKALKGDDDEG